MSGLFRFYLGGQWFQFLDCLAPSIANSLRSILVQCNFFDYPNIDHELLTEHLDHTQIA